MILPPVHQLMYSVQQDNISGSELLQLLQAKVTDHTLRTLPACVLYLASQCPAMSFAALQAQCGIPELQSCLTRLLWHCNQVLFKQLSGWYGDPFFHAYSQPSVAGSCYPKSHADGHHASQDIHPTLCLPCTQSLQWSDVCVMLLFLLQ